MVDRVVRYEDVRAHLSAVGFCTVDCSEYTLITDLSSGSRSVECDTCNRTFGRSESDQRSVTRHNTTKGHLQKVSIKFEIRGLEADNIQCPYCDHLYVLCILILG